MVETTGIAYRYDAPQSEAPNAILIAAPPKLGGIEGWTPKNPKLLAQTISDTIELMQIRMLTSDKIIGNPILGKLFPALIFKNSTIGEGKSYHDALFPMIPKKLYKYWSPEPFHHANKSIISPVDQGTTNIGGHKK